jgi:hypothetical protein
MNANEIWSGNDYAQTDNISRGVAFYERANRVKALRVYKEIPPYTSSYGARERATTMVEVLMLDPETGEARKRGEEDYIRSVRARDIFMRWDEYAVEKERRDNKRNEIAAEEARIRAEEENAKAALIDKLEARFNTGFNRLMIRSINDYAIVLDRRQVEEWLNA